MGVLRCSDACCVVHGWSSHGVRMYTIHTEERRHWLAALARATSAAQQWHTVLFSGAAACSAKVSLDTVFRLVKINLPITLPHLGGLSWRRRLSTAELAHRWIVSNRDLTGLLYQQWKNISPHQSRSSTLGQTRSTTPAISNQQHPLNVELHFAVNCII